jgi:prophage tail gpP-like protein
LVKDVKDSELKKAVISKAGRMFGNACSYQLTVRGHRDKDDKIWRKNTLINLKSTGSMIYKTTKFLIKKVTIKRSPDSGDTAIMDLVLPESYSGDEINSYPWEK